jgi:hypothetical protein
MLLKGNAREWKNLIPPVKFKTQPLTGNVMLTLFWDSQGPNLEHHRMRGTTVNSVSHSEMTWDHLNPANQQKQ